MKPYIRLSVLILLSLTLASSAFAATWYVNSTNGSDNNSCQTATSACQTITHAISLAASGDTIMVAPGFYPGGFTIPFNLSIVGAGPGKSYIYGSGSSNAGSVITIPGTRTVLLSGLTIQHGNATNGGGIVNSGNLTLTNSIVSGNNAGVVGGGIVNYNYGTLTIDKSMILYNYAPQGGGIYCSLPSGDVRITNSTIAINHATVGNGGGIYSSCHVLFINTTIAENTAFHGYGGGYSAFGDLGSAYFLNATVSQNRAGPGGTINQGAGVFGAVFFEDTIVAANGGGNCGNSVTSNGYNLSDDNTCNFSAAGDLNNADPMLGPLTSNGGPTWTMALPQASPAIDAGNPNGCPSLAGGSPTSVLLNDQRGDKRPGDPSLKTGCDMGAYEYQFAK